MEIIGNQRQLEHLENAARLGMLSHAYIFSGPSKVGKRTLAVEFARRQYCNKRGDTEGKCPNCRAILDYTHPDFFVIDPERSDRAEIGIEEIRDLRTKLILTPYGSAATTIIINDAERLTHEAVSALLKILEEPRPNTRFILITADPGVIPDTIRSRAHTLSFLSVPHDAIERYLIETYACDTQDARVFARCSFGRPGLAIDMARLGEKHPLVRYGKILNVMIGGGYEERLKQVERLVGESEYLFDFLDSFTIFIRDVMMVRLGCDDLAVCRERYAHLDAITSRYTRIKLLKLLQYIERVRRAFLTTNVNSRLALEALILEF